MKFKITTVLAFCFLAATTVFAQSWDSEIEGSDTTGYIPVFTSFQRVANSSIFEAPGGDVGIGMTAPFWPVLVLSSKTVDELKSRADSGDAAARHQLAEFLISSDPAAPGYDSAFSWLRSMASQNVPDARFLLGYLYEHGKGVPRDYVQAFENYSASAHEGYAPAENNLGTLYHHGNGVPKSLDEAFRWYRAAALKGNPSGEHNLGNFYYLGYATPVDYSQAVKWFRAAAEQGFAPAQSSLAYCYLKGVGVSTNYDEAVRWARLAADQGHASAEALLGYLYENGKGLPLNYISAYAWYSRAAAAGDASSPDRLNSLSRIMTRKQLDQANTVVASQSNPHTPMGPWEK